MTDPFAFRIGHGFDVHAFEPGEHLCLGGCRIPFNQGFRAHSDGDVLLHAICDALLGAAALGDIGRHFPIPMPAGEVRTAGCCCAKWSRCWPARDGGW